MSKTSEALADVRRWLCENLSAGDAGKVCGMLSVVSRHIVALEAENSKLRKLVRDMGRVLDGCFPTNCMWHCPRFDGHCCDNGTDTCLFNKDIRELGVEVPE